MSRKICEWCGESVKIRGMGGHRRAARCRSKRAAKTVLLQEAQGWYPAQWVTAGTTMRGQQSQQLIFQVFTAYQVKYIQAWGHNRYYNVIPDALYVHDQLLARAFAIAHKIRMDWGFHDGRARNVNNLQILVRTWREHPKGLRAWCAAMQVWCLTDMPEQKAAAALQMLQDIENTRRSAQEERT